MDDVSDKIQSLLNDEESMRQIKELADMLTAGQATSGEQNGSSSMPDMSSLAGMFGGLGGGSPSSESSSDQDSLFSGLDLGTMMQMGQILSASSAPDPNRDLLLAHPRPQPAQVLVPPFQAVVSIRRLQFCRQLLV